MLELRFSKNSPTAKEILLTLARVGIFTIAATSPYFFRALIKKYFKDATRKQRAAKARKLRELQKRKLISLHEDKNSLVTIKLSHRGKFIIRQYQLDEMKLSKPKKWDGKWRIVIYDIPHHQKRGRDALREKIKQMGLYPLQKSIWVSPYDFLNELEFICAVFDLELDKDIFYLTANQIPKNKEIKRFFDLT